MIIVGLPDTAVRESRERICAAINNSGYFSPIHKVTINLAPADVRKEGASFDLPIALGILGAHGDIRAEVLPDIIAVGELSLDGRVRPVRGELSIALTARRLGVKNLLVPEENAREAAVVHEDRVYPVGDLRTAAQLAEEISAVHNTRVPPTTLDLLDLNTSPEYASASPTLAGRGRPSVRSRWRLPAAATFSSSHAQFWHDDARQAAPDHLPPLEFEEALEITKIHSAGELTVKSGLITERPFKSPHHAVSQVGLIGGGSVPRPGEVSLAHLGVLFLDELPELDRSVLEVLRQPMEDKEVTISRVASSLTFLANFHIGR